MQQSGGSRSQYGGGQPQPQPQLQPTPPMAVHQLDPQSHMVVEEASPISSRPPAGGNLDEVFREAEALAAAGDEPDRGSASGGNRWPRQETLALIRIRSEMDAIFRDATLKGPLWEDVSRKLAELGYKRSAKKCKEKFENVHKYYKRTKEGRAGRQDGKNYKYFSELEALHGGSATSTATPLSTTPPIATVTFTVTPANPTTTTTSAPATSFFQAPASGTIGFSGPAPISTVRIPGTTGTPPPQVHVFRPESSPAAAPAVVPGSVPPRTSSPAGVNVSSNGSSSSPGSEDDEDTEEIEGNPSNTAASSRKRKRETPISGGSTTRQMMEFFEGLMKQAMEKQEAMQRRFFEAMERREQDRMIREEAWRRQEMARLSREHELMAQDRAATAARDQAIISFLQQITGQTIPVSQNVIVPASTAPPTPPPSVPPPLAPQPQPQPQPQTTHVPAPYPLPSPSPQPPTATPQQPSYQQQQQLQPQTKQQYQHQNVSTEVIVAIPEQQVPPQELALSSGGSEPSSSRWPKAEVLALIKLRSELEARYQEAGPKGPLWEEISSGMQKMGYKRNAKRCKEKWENINKYFKKVKESNKKRPEDSKTCPYFHQLDALYRNKVIGGSTSGGSNGDFSAQVGGAQGQHRSDVVQGIRSERQVVMQTVGGDMDANKHAEGNGNGTGNKPEDTVKELTGQQQNHQVDKLNEPDSDNLDLEEDEEEDDMDEGEEDDEEMEDSKMAYKIEFQRQNAAGSRSDGGNGQPSFMAMVQ